MRAAARCPSAWSVSVLGLVFTVLACVVAATAAPSPVRAESGDVVWSSEWALSSAEDQFRKIAPGPAGSVYAVGPGDEGYDYRPRVIVARYDASGSVAWAHAFDGSKHMGASGGTLAVDGQGAVIVGANSRKVLSQEEGWQLRKYDAGGSTQWSIGPDISTGFEGIADLEVDGDGDVYVTGTTGTSPDRLIVVRYSGADGTELWRRDISRRGGIWVHDLVVSTGGSVYVAGKVELPGGTADCLFARWKADGDALWVKTWDGGHGRDDQLTCIALRATRRGTSLYVGGLYGVSDDHDHAALLRYRTDGTRVWQREYACARTGPTDTLGITVDGRGRVAAIANFDARKPLLRRAWLTKWTPGGTRLWKTCYPVAGTGAKTGALFYSVAGDASGRIWCGGGTSLQSASWPVEWFVARYRADGTRAWLRRWYPDPGQVGAVCKLVCLGADHALFAAGYTVSDATSCDFAIRRYVR